MIQSFINTPARALFGMLVAVIASLALIGSGFGPGPASAAESNQQPLAITLTPTPEDPTPTPTPTEIIPTVTPTEPTPTVTPTDPTPTVTPVTPTPTMTPTDPTPTETPVTPTPITPSPTPTLTPETPPPPPPPVTPPDEEDPPPGVIPGTGQLRVYESSASMAFASSLSLDRSVGPARGQQALTAARIWFGGLDDTSVQRVELPSLGVRSLVREMPRSADSWDIAGLGTQVANLQGTSRPGLGSNTALVGHISVLGVGNGPFRYLNLLSVGDEIVVYTQRGIYTYQVREQLVVKPSQVEVLAESASAQVTLITCTGWDENAEEYRLRRVIQADLVSIKARDRQVVGGVWVE